MERAGNHSFTTRLTPRTRLFRHVTRYHKPLVLDMMDTDSWDLLQDRFEAVQRNLLHDILTKYVAKEEW